MKPTYTLKPKSKTSPKIKGERHEFTEMSQSTIRNLTPPQFQESGHVTSSRKHEVTREDNTLKLISALQAEKKALLARIAELEKRLELPK